MPASYWRRERKEMLNLDTIFNENCLDTMARMPNCFVDLTVTSPPYDNLRSYNGYSYDFEAVAKELYRVTKQGGVVVWVVGDATIKGSETGTSFRQALYFKECGFNLHDTMIFKKHGMPTDPRLRYYQRFEYMFIFSKKRPSSYNPIADICSSNRKQSNGVDRRGDKLVITNKQYITKLHVIRGNIWEYNVRNIGAKHPAAFPEQLANDHIITWSNEGDLVYDPFLGSGTTAKMAILNNRKYIGSEISEEYCKIAEERTSCAKE